MSTKGNERHSLKDVWGYIAAFTALLSGLATLTLQVRAWLQDAQTLRYVSIAPFVVFFVTTFWFARKMGTENREGWLRAVLVVLFLVSCGYAFLWGTWVEPYTPTCSDYDIHITSPLTDTRVQQSVIEIRGAQRRDPPQSSMVIIIRSPDGAQNWFSSTPVQVDSVLGEWRGVAALGGEPPQSYRIAVALMGRSGRALLEYYNKVGRETGQWPAIEFLPDDIEICDQVSITR